MQVCGQTLILVDSDGTVSEVNQKIIKSTLKYMMYHSPENRAFCISTYGHNLDEEEQYVTDINDLICDVELLEFEPKDSNLTDVLCATLSNWKESDFACRDIVVFTDGLEGASTEYEEEELYYLINNTSYPIYVVDLVQEGNGSAKKFLSAISTTSGGKLFFSEYPGDDADVDRVLSEGIFAEMDEYAKTEWVKYEENEINQEENQDSENTNDNSTDISDEEPMEGDTVGALDADLDSPLSDELITGDFDTEGVVLLDEDSPAFFESTAGVLCILGIVGALIVAGIVLGLVCIKRKRQDTKEDEEIKEIVRSNTCPQEMFCDDGFTTMLTIGAEEGTRLLNVESVHKIELSDVENSDNTRLLCVATPLCIGRSALYCDMTVDDDSVSKRHCEFRYENGNYFVKDLDSSNGTYLNDERIIEEIIKTGDKIKIGRSTYRVKCYE